jgi:transketolase
MATDLDLLCINTVRTLSMDAVQAADSGHPGTPMALAPLGYALFTKHMRHDPADPKWVNRDRFVLSCGHASMLLYSCLFLSGYDLSLDDIREFRQWDSKTPGHPEYGHTEGVETTTGPLGQGVGNAVGMAVAQAHLAATFPAAPLDHYTWFIASDGDLMEGISHEAASFAGHFGLGRLIGFYDDNKITIDGSTDLTFSDDTAKRFEAYGWQVLHLDDVNDLGAIDRVVAEAKADTARPTLVVTRTHIGFGSPNKQDTAKAHGEPLGKDEIALTKKNLGWESTEPFFVPDAALAEWRRARNRGARDHSEWVEQWNAWTDRAPDDARELQRRLAGERGTAWESALPAFTAETGNVATRAASGTVLTGIANALPELVGGSADLTPSNNTLVKAWHAFSRERPDGRYVHYGIREHAMGSIMNGMALHGGVLPYGGTFLIFSDYMRPAIRLAALMKQQVIYVFTHDSIGLGEDGPTHQPIEQLTALRAIPGLTVIRPADAVETVGAWRVAVQHRNGPVALMLTRQKLGHRAAGIGQRETHDGVAHGGYVAIDATGGKPQVVLMSSGSEVGLIVKAAEQLAAQGVRARVVSMPSHELFLAQSEEYRNSVLPAGVPRVAIEAGHPMSWDRFLGQNGVMLGISRFGASAPHERIYEELELTVQAVVDAASERVS